MAEKRNLVIVESPAKAKTIGKFLGEGYKVLSSYGHIRDLKPNNFSIDIERNFEPLYEVSEEKQKVVRELQQAAQSSDVVRSEEHTSELQSRHYLVCRLLLEKKY